MTDCKQDDHGGPSDDQSLVMVITSSTVCITFKSFPQHCPVQLLNVVAITVYAYSTSSAITSGASGPSGLPWGLPPPRESSSLTGNTGQHMAGGITCCNPSTETPTTYYQALQFSNYSSKQTLTLALSPSKQPWSLGNRGGKKPLKSRRWVSGRWLDAIVTNEA